MSDNQNTHFNINQTAKMDFDQALRKSYWRSVMSSVTQTDNSLLSYDEVRQHLPYRGEHYIGLKQIEVDKIIGSVNRYEDFDRAFLPREGHIRSRWESIDRAHLTDVILPPIEVYKIGKVFFVKDGNHRVSVAREKGQVYIDADVIEIDVPVEVDEHTDLQTLVLLEEEGRFLDETHLNDLRPDSKVKFSINGQYDKLLEHISTHRWFMGVEQNHAIPYAEAVASWFDDVYMPLVNVIRQQGLMKHFPNRTEADLYLWIIERLYYLRERVSKEITFEEAVEDFAEQYSSQSSTWLSSLMHSLGRLFTPDETLPGKDSPEASFKE